MPIIRFDGPAAAIARSNFPLSPRRCFFDDGVVTFLQEFSRVLLKDARARRYPDLVAFAYLCRRTNLHALAQRYADAAQRTGWGTVVHVAPSNVPINFAFSLVFGILAGNSNVVRMPSRDFPQNALWVELFDRVAAAPEFSSIAASNILIQTERGSAELETLIAVADGLVVWGGDATAHAFRALPKKPRCTELYFPDRLSSAVLDATAYLTLSQNSRQQLAHDFYNDTYLVDQNACSSPSMIIWIGQPGTISAAKKAFWQALADELTQQEYHLDPAARIDKHLDFMAASQKLGRAVHLEQYSPDIWCVQDQTPLAGTPLRFGHFIELNLPAIDGIAALLRPQEQTLTYFGVSARGLLRLINDCEGHTVDRIVPIGKALDLNPFWDGKDILAQLSRRIDLVERPSPQAAIQA